MHFAGLSLLATSVVVAALPSFGFHGSVSSDTEAPCLDSQVHLNSPEDTLDFGFMIRHLATGDFMGVAELEAYLPVKLGFETIFTLNHGVLSTAGRDYLGNQLVVSGSERWGLPPRLTLVRGQGEAAGPDFKLPIKVTDRRGLLLINAEKSDQKLTAYPGHPFVILVPSLEDGQFQIWEVIRVQ